MQKKGIRFEKKFKIILFIQSFCQGTHGPNKGYGKGPPPIPNMIQIPRLDQNVAGAGGVFDVGDIADITEECTENCAHLYFYDKDGNQITAV